MCVLHVCMTLLNQLFVLLIKFVVSSEMPYRNAFIIVVIIILCLFILLRIRAKVSEPYTKILARTTQLRHLHASIFPAYA